MDYWVNFIRSGDPNAPQLQNWPLFDRKAGKVMTLDREIAPRVHQSLGICDILLPSTP
jgi:carboxylesterase type B